MKIEFGKFEMTKVGMNHFLEGDVILRANSRTLLEIFDFINDSCSYYFIGIYAKVTR